MSLLRPGASFINIFNNFLNKEREKENERQFERKMSSSHFVPRADAVVEASRLKVPKICYDLYIVRFVLIVLH